MMREKDEDLVVKDIRGYSCRKVEDLKNCLMMINKFNVDLYLSIYLNVILFFVWRGV